MTELLSPISKQGCSEIRRPIAVLILSRMGFSPVPGLEWFFVFLHNDIGESELLSSLPISFPMHLIRGSFPTLVVGAFQVLGLLQNIDLRDKFLRSQFVIVNA